MPNALRYVLDGGPLDRYTSALTKRRIEVNPDPARFVVTDGWTARRLTEARRDFAELLENGYSARKGSLGGGAKEKKHIIRATAALCEPVLNAGTREAFLEALDDLLRFCLTDDWATPELFALVRERDAGIRSHIRTPVRAGKIVVRVKWMLVTLWRHGIIVAPSGDGTIVASRFAAADLPAFAPLGWGALASLILSVADVNKPTRKGKKSQDRTDAFQRGVARLLLTTRGVKEIGDLDLHTLAAFTEAFKSFKVVAVPTLMLDAIDRVHRRDCGGGVDAPALRSILPGRGRSREGGRWTEPTFEWMSHVHPEYPLWREAAARWATQVDGLLGLGKTCGSLATALNRLLSLDGVPARPLDFCAKSFAGTTYAQRVFTAMGSESSHLRRMRKNLRTYFASVLTEEATRADGSLNPQFHNPADGVRIKKHKGSKGQTHREPMRPWLVREIRAVLATEAWARSLEDDTFVYADPTSGIEQWIWSPVRLEAFRLRFLLPLRNLQVQLLDTGEGDTRIWAATPQAPLRGAWVVNEGPWRPAPGETRQLGVLRPIFDADLGREITGLFVNTNKTGDSAKEFEQLGYEIPWESEEIISLVLRLNAWQQQYNPSRGPLKRTELHLSEAASADVDAVLPAYHFLFRDPCHPGRKFEPVTQERLRNFWLKLLDECEKRLNDRLKVGDPTGRAVQLITARSASGQPEKARYDLHTLRVTGLTELAVNGCPVQVLMMLAGHATWVMTLYYVKPSMSDFRRELNAARERAALAMDGETWEQIIGSADFASLRELPLGNAADGLQARAANPADSWRVMDYGECPNGGTLCHIGGDRVLRGRRDGDLHAPVEGGQSNCTACRFFTYTPAHLFGLISRANAQLLDVQESGDRLRSAELARRELFAESLDSRDNALFRSRLSRADAAVEAAEDRAVKAGKAFQATHRCIARAKAALGRYIQQGTGSSRALPVLLNGTVDDLQLSFEQCSDYDLWTRICEDSEINASVDPTVAALRRAARLDRLLAQAGEGAIFATLTDEESVAVGNMYARWLRTKLGPVDHEALLRGERTLRDLGIISESDALLSPVRTKLAPPVNLPSRPALALGAGQPSAGV